MKSNRLWPLLLLLLGVATPAQAQFIGFVTPQSTQVKAINAATGPTTSVIPNAGQSSHFLTYTTTGSPTAARIQFEGSFDGVNFQPISQEATDGTAAGLYASGYFPVVRVNLIRIVGGVSPTVTAFYSGTSGAAPNPGGIFNRSPLSRVTIWDNVALPSPPNVLIATPYGNTAGYIFMSVATGTSTFCTVTVGGITFRQVFNNALTSTLTVSSTEILLVPDLPGQTVQVNISCDGTGNVNGEYFFLSPTTAFGPPYTPNHITTATNTFLKLGSGILHAIVINTAGGAGATATIFDTRQTNCAAAGNLGVLNTNAGPVTINYDLFYQSGLCITTAGASPADITVLFR